MRDISFYLSALRACRCGKPASYEVRATGNVTYDHCCKTCAPKRLKELERTYNRPKAPPARTTTPEAPTDAE